MFTTFCIIVFPTLIFAICFPHNQKKVSNHKPDHVIPPLKIFQYFLSQLEWKEKKKIVQEPTRPSMIYPSLSLQSCTFQPPSPCWLSSSLNGLFIIYRCVRLSFNLGPFFCILLLPKLLFYQMSTWLQDHFACVFPKVSPCVRHLQWQTNLK